MALAARGETARATARHIWSAGGNDAIPMRPTMALPACGWSAGRRAAHDHLVRPGGQSAEHIRYGADWRPRYQHDMLRVGAVDRHFEQHGFSIRQTPITSVTPAVIVATTAGAA